MSIESNLELLNGQILQSCKKVGRSPSEVKLLAVSKLQPVSAIHEAMKHGHRAFGENYVQEWRKKSEEFRSSNIEWHLIGPLQKNKCKYVVGNISLIHSVDSLELARELNRIGEQKGVTQDILLQINLGDESTKSGASVREGAQMVKEMESLKNLCLKGLMALPPLLSEPEKSRPYFKRLKECSMVWFDGRPGVLLSMGTSHDFQIAIEEGSHIVRVGTALFGERLQK